MLALIHSLIQLLPGLLGGAPFDEAAVRAAVDFNRDVRPILSNNCYKCHGPDGNQRKAKLRLDLRDVALERAAFVPGKPEESTLVARVFSAEDDFRMPPPESGKHLSEAQKETLRRWVEEGAPYALHWSHAPLTRPRVPEVADRAWVKTPIDAFILSALERRGLSPSPAADARTWLRRVHLDLLGIPPASAEVRLFLSEPRTRREERAVDRLLRSPHYGERMAGPWLDLVRYADTVGYHGDQNQRIFPYRDYVIESFNRNKPFDQFTIEQIAGDLLEKPTTEQLVATGFNRLNMMTREGGAQPGEYLAKYQADRVRTVATTWLGSTMGCCECHDHKFDPFLTRDFYSLAAFFADLRQWGVYTDYDYTPNPDLKGFTNDHPFPPEIEVDSEYLRHREARLLGEMRKLLEDATRRMHADEATRSSFEEWRSSCRGFLEDHSSGWVRPDPMIVAAAAPSAAPSPAALEVRPVAADAAGTTSVPGLTLQPDQSVLIQQGSSAAFRLELEAATPRIAALRLELLPSAAHGGSILRDGHTATTVHWSVRLRGADGSEMPLAFRHAQANHFDPRYRNGFDLIGVKDGWLTSAAHKDAAHDSVWVFDAPVRTSAGNTLVVVFNEHAAGCVRISLTSLLMNEPYLSSWRERFAAVLDEPDGRRAGAAYLLSTGADGDLLARYKALEQEVLECRGGKAWTMVSQAAEPFGTRVLPRGNWQDESGEVVQPATPQFLPPPAGSGNADGLLNRLDLSRWLVAPDNPLTARVFVNRLWKLFFGTALSAVVDDLGSQGEVPVHPDLLDWIACEFRDSGFDVKHVVRLIVTSNTYAQSSRVRTEMLELDPGNRLLAAQNPRRLEAELVRDGALFIAGLLNLESGGPSSRPYQPPVYYMNLQFPDRDYVAHADERQYRRGIYMHWQRTFLHPMLANFDASPREECAAFRPVANTPQQALTLLNDPTFVEAARIWAERLLDSGDRSDEERLDAAMEQALARLPRPEERESLLTFLGRERAHYALDAEAARKLVSVGLSPVANDVPVGELAVWTSVCRVLLNLHETITVQ